MTKHDNVSQGKIMKATEFVKEFGWDEAKGLIAKHEKCYMPDVFDMWSDELQDFVLCTKYASFDMSDLKRLVESHEILGLFKSLDQAKADVAACEYAGHADLLVKLDCGIGYINTAKVKQAIADVEACHEVN